MFMILMAVMVLPVLTNHEHWDSKVRRIL